MREGGFTAKLKMQKIEIIGLMQDSKKIVERLQRRGIVELTDIKDDRLVKLNTAQSVSLFEKNKTKLEHALEILERFSPEKASVKYMFKGKAEIEKHDFGKKAEMLEKVMKTAAEIELLDKSCTDAKNENARLVLKKNNLSFWLPLDIPTGFKGTENTAFFIGSIPESISTEELSEQLPESSDINIISTSKTQTNFCVLALKNEAVSVGNALRKLGFVPFPEESDLTPRETVEKINEQIERNKGLIEKNESMIISHAKYRDDIKFMIDYLGMRSDKYAALNRLALTRETIIITGYIPQKYVSALSNELEKKYTVAISTKEPNAEDDVPVLLENSRFSSPVEGITEMYSLPGKDDLDPTPVMSFFYYLFFGMMLSDAGYGILMVLGTSLALRKFKLEAKMKKTLTMFKYCGISTIFWGALFGSWFGDIVQVVSKQFFGKEIGSLALWFEPLADPIKLLLFSFGLGICHLFLGLGANLVNLWRQGRRLDAICEVIPVYITIIGAAPLGASILTTVPSVFTQIGLYVAAVGAILVVLTSGRTAKSFLSRIFGGLYGLYNMATGYLSDILSYSRLLALGLATGSIASVINLIGSMPSNLVLKAIMLILVFVVGHTANLAINLLGAYVHTDRLQFVELFSKFYEGGGRAFEPLSVKTKFIKFKEEIFND